MRVFLYMLFTVAVTGIASGQPGSHTDPIIVELGADPAVHLKAGRLLAKKAAYTENEADFRQAVAHLKTLSKRWPGSTTEQRDASIEILRLCEALGRNSCIESEAKKLQKLTDGPAGLAAAFEASAALRHSDLQRARAALRNLSGVLRGRAPLSEHDREALQLALSGFTQLGMEEEVVLAFYRLGAASEDFRDGRYSYLLGALTSAVAYERCDLFTSMMPEISRALGEGLSGDEAAANPRISRTLVDYQARVSSLEASCRSGTIN